MSDEGDPDASEIAEAPPLRIAPRMIGDEFGQALIAHINEKAVIPDDGCQVCGSNNNSVQGTLYQVDVQPEEGAFSSGQAMPLAATVCYNCGFVRFFSVPIVRELLKGVVFPLGGPGDIPAELDDPDAG